MLREKGETVTLWLIFLVAPSSPGGRLHPLGAGCKNTITREFPYHHPSEATDFQKPRVTQGMQAVCRP